MRLHAVWLASSDGASRWITSRSIWPFSGSGFGQDACGAGDHCLHAGYANQIGRIWTGSQGAVCLNLPRSQGSLEPFGRRRRLHELRRAGCRPGQVRRRREVLEPVEPRDHALSGGDLQGGWPFGYWLPPALGSFCLSL
jgi:hypothetical protein